MKGIIRTGLITVISLAMVLTMFPLCGSSSAYAATYNEDDGLTVVIDGSRLTVEVLPQVLGTDDDGEFDYYMNFDPNEEPGSSAWQTPAWETAENQNAVTTVFIGQGTLRLGTYSFRNFSNIDTLYIPKSMYIIDPDAFAGCSSIKTIYYGGTQKEWNTLMSAKYTGAGNDALKASSVSVECGEGYRDMGDAKVKLSKNTYVFKENNGDGFEPDVTVKWKGESLKISFDYAVGYGGRENVGQDEVIVDGYNRYVGSKTVKFKIIPKKTSIKEVTSPAKKKIKVRWYRQSKKMAASRITGYQVKVARDSAFTKEVRTFKVKGYKNLTKTIRVKSSHKRYYAKVRTYKVVSGKTYYSNWSKVKSKVVK